MESLTWALIRIRFSAQQCFQGFDGAAIFGENRNPRTIAFWLVVFVVLDALSFWMAPSWGWIHQDMLTLVNAAVKSLVG